MALPVGEPRSGKLICAFCAFLWLIIRAMPRVIAGSGAGWSLRVDLFVMPDD
jgi:hypothetical protein